MISVNCWTWNSHEERYFLWWFSASERKNAVIPCNISAARKNRESKARSWDSASAYRTVLQLPLLHFRIYCIIWSVNGFVPYAECTVIKNPHRVGDILSSNLTATEYHLRGNLTFLLNTLTELYFTPITREKTKLMIANKLKMIAALGKDR